VGGDGELGGEAGGVKGVLGWVGEVGKPGGLGEVGAFIGNGTLEGLDSRVSVFNMHRGGLPALV
jgi:hypothetical protein